MCEQSRAGRPYPKPLMRSVGLLAVLVGLALIVPLGAGLLVDSWQGSSPIGMLAGVGVGSVVAIVVVCRSYVRSLDRYLQDERDEGQPKVS
jgi:F0F1-type ATP synthase assembly protein I